MKKVLFSSFSNVFIVFDHANACASMRLLVEIHNSYICGLASVRRCAMGSKRVVATEHIIQGVRVQIPSIHLNTPPACQLTGYPHLQALAPSPTPLDRVVMRD